MWNRFIYLNTVVSPLCLNPGVDDQGSEANARSCWGGGRLLMCVASDVSPRLCSVDSLHRNLHSGAFVCFGATRWASAPVLIFWHLKVQAFMPKVAKVFFIYFIFYFFFSFVNIFVVCCILRFKAGISSGLVKNGRCFSELCCCYCFLSG